MDTQAGSYLNIKAITSPVGIARFWEIVFGCTTFSLVVHKAGFDAAYGIFCIFVWCFCFGITVFIVTCEFTQLHGCLRISWENFTISFAMLATLMSVTASVVYPLYFIQLSCEPISCEVRNFRIATCVFSALACITYAVEVGLTKARPGHITSYMATTSGLLKIVQAFVACVIFGALANDSQYKKHIATQCCVAIYSICFIVTLVIILFNVSGKTATFRCPFDRFVVTYTFLAILVYLSAAVVWPVFCFDSKYGSPQRPNQCPREDTIHCPAVERERSREKRDSNT
nr:PREDICTED: myeloid-associated differentiation marker-like protein 2 isoform X5 [Latimeria chalumnae]|eukprot:XP_005989112.1 PREDICTED: myeloid-associated differentiation marker-like protein 2 isoform X5 [Latimeria chalumnae]